MTHFSQRQVLDKLNIAALNPMQEAALETIRSNADVVLLSPTGSGKTLGFLLPVLEQLDPDKEGVQALIVTPTRELALQIESVFRAMGTAFKVNATYGGHSMRVEANNFSEPPAVLVGTPGRLVDHLNRRNLDLGGVQTLVLDEFDKSLEMGFHEDITIILQRLKRIRKRVLTSATDLEELPAFTGIKHPARLDFLAVSKPKLTFKTITCEDTEKHHALLRLLCTITPDPTLIFCNHREVVERINGFLAEEGIVNLAFHGGMEQDERERALLRFRNGSARYFVTTDLGSRGLDIPDIQHVIHYQLPHAEDAFIHRNGRTARQNASGTAYLLLSQHDEALAWLPEETTPLTLSESAGLPPAPEWTTVYFSGGKKDKINKIDLVGFLSKIGGLQQGDIGLISVLDHTSFVAVNARKTAKLMPLIRNEKVKGKKLKIALSR